MGAKLTAQRANCKLSRKERLSGQREQPAGMENVQDRRTCKIGEPAR